MSTDLTTKNANKGLILLNSRQMDESSPPVSFSRYLDTLIKLLPGFSDPKVCSGVVECRDLDYLAAKVEHLRVLHNTDRFLVIVRDEELDSDDGYQFLTNGILQKRASQASALTDNYAFLYLDKEQKETFLDEHEQLSVRTRLSDDGAKTTATPSSPKGQDRPPDDFWPRVATSNLRDGLINMTTYFIKLGMELKLIPENVARQYTKLKKENLVDSAIEFTKSKLNVDCVDPVIKLNNEQRAFRKILLENLDEVAKATGIIKESGMLYFNEVRGAPQWSNITGKSLRFFPNSAYIQKCVRTKEINNRSQLKTVFKSLGLRTATAEDERLRYGKILEKNWSNISNTTGVFRIYDQDQRCYKYFFCLGNTSTVKYPWPKVVGDRSLKSFPDSKIIKKATDEKIIHSLNNLKKVWATLGLTIADVAEDNVSSLKKLVESKWETIASNTGIRRMPGEDGELKYYFSACKTSPSAWGGIGSIPVARFPSGLFVKQVIGKPTINTPEEMKRVWKRLGLTVATEKEESLEHFRKAIRTHWDNITKNTGIRLLPGIDNKNKYYFKGCTRNTEIWGQIGTVLVKEFPSADFIRSVTGADTISKPEELKQVWTQLGIKNIADTKEENLSLVRGLIEENWDEISKNTGIYKLKAERWKEAYYFDSCKSKPHLWGKVGTIPLKDFPSASFIRSVTGADTIDTVDKLKLVWAKLGFIIGTNEQAEVKALVGYKRELVEYIPEIVKSTGIVYENGIFYFDSCVGNSKWCRVNDRPLSSFPSPEYIENLTATRQIRSAAALKKVLGSMGVRVATDEEEKLRYGRVLEDHWGRANVTEKTGVERRYDVKEKCFKYYFLLAKTSSGGHRWPKVTGRMLEHYPGAEIIKSILNNKSQIDTVAELKTVWKALGLRIATEDEEKKELPRKIIEENWDELEKNTHIFKLPGLAVTGGGKPPPKYYFGLAKATAQNWGRVPGHNMVKGFPASHIIQEYTNEPTAQSLEQLKILWRALGLEIATEEEEATLPRRLIEMNWREISKNTGIRCRLVQEHKTDEPKIKYFFEFAHGRSQWGKVSDIKSISNFPNPDFIRSVTGKDSIITAGELKKVWKALGIEVATDEEEKKLPKWLIEDSWSNITKHSGIILLPTLDGYKYHFRFAKQAKDWGGVRAAGDRKIQYYPSGPFVTSILGKKRAQSPNELKNVWKALGFEIATKEEECDLPRAIIEELNWDYISENTGVKRVQATEGDYTYYFSKAKGQDSWGIVPGIKKRIATFPDIAFIRDVLDGGVYSSRTEIRSIDELAEVWRNLGLKIATRDEEEQWLRLQQARISANT